VIELCASTKSARQIAQEYDVSNTTIQRWKDELLGGKEAT
jgi:transposase